MHTDTSPLPTTSKFESKNNHRASAVTLTLYYARAWCTAFSDFLSEEPSNVDVACQTTPKLNVDGTKGREAEVVR